MCNFIKVIKGGNGMKKLIVCSIIIVFAFGCASVPLKVTNISNLEYDELGEGVGSATGIMLFNLIPIGQNTRFKQAYQAAIDSKEGDQLLNPVITEDWFWAYILNGYKTTVTGTVIKFRK